MKNLSVSIIIPVLNAEKYISKCLESMVTVNYPKDDIEIIVVDNGSTDKTVELTRKFQNKNNNIKLFFEKIKSSYAARNLGVKKSKGDIVIFTDADCIADSNWITNIVRYFNNDIVGGVAGEILSEKGNSIVERYTVISGFMSQKTPFNSELPYAITANAAYRKELFNIIGYFNEIVSGGDADYSWRMILETDYHLVYAHDAIVFHKHRTNLKGLFKQRFKHGYGFRMLREKYKGRLNHLKNKNMSKINSFVKIKKFLERIKKDYILLLPAFVNAFGFNLGKMYARFLLLIHRYQRS